MSRRGGPEAGTGQRRVATRRDADGGRHELRCPGVGWWSNAPATGDLLRAGDGLGTLEILGRRVGLQVPEGAGGIVVAQGGDADRARRPMDHGSLLVLLDPTTSLADLAAPTPLATRTDGTLVFRAPSSGRFWSRTSPERPPLVKPGDTLQKGQVAFILEVMKTFTRVAYDGDGLPDPARVLRVVPQDGDDLTRGDPILELAPTEPTEP